MATSVDQKLLRQTKFPSEFNQKVDMQKVNIEVMKKWIASKISEILGSEDDVVIELCFNLLDGARYPNIKVLQIQLTGFLEKDTASFCKELWTLCLSAQSNPQGVPKELLEAKKLELIQEKIEADKAAEAARRRQDQERTRDRNMENMRHGRFARKDHTGDVRGRNDRDSYGRRNYPSRELRNSRSPSSRQRRVSPESRLSVSRREIDTYIPSGSPRESVRRHRRAEVPSQSPSRSPSRTPPRKTIRRPSSRSFSRSPSPQTNRSSYHGHRGGGKYSAANKGDHSHGRDLDRSYPVVAPRSRSPRGDHRLRKSSLTPPIKSAPSKSNDESTNGGERNRESSSKSPAHLTRSNPHRGSSHGNIGQESETKSHRRSDQQYDRSSSLSVSPQRYTKRLRSPERFEPKAKRRRNSSSVDSSDRSNEVEPRTKMIERRS